MSDQMHRESFARHNSIFPLMPDNSSPKIEVKTFQPIDDDEVSTLSTPLPPPNTDNALMALPSRSGRNNDLMNERRVLLNVGGHFHETFLTTLRRMPQTRLARLADDYERDQAYDPETGSFFFNRNPAIFLSVLQYYRTGELHLDHNLCGIALKNELEFWQIDPNDIEPCCWTQYARYIESRETLQMLEANFSEVTFPEPKPDASNWHRLQCQMWRLIEDPSYSVVGRIFAGASLFFVVLSILTYVLGTHPLFRVPNPDDNDDSASNSTTTPSINSGCQKPSVKTNKLPVQLDENNSTIVWWLSAITFVCLVWFLIEYLLRMIMCPNKKEFFKSLYNNLDLLVLLVMIFECLAIVLGDIMPPRRYVQVLTPLRFARIVRLMKLMKHYRAFKVVVYTIKFSLKELALMVTFLMIGVVIFASIIHYVEPESFPNIPIGCWWAIVTMATLGYGDFVPRYIGGYIIGSIAAVFGVLTIAFTVPIVVNNFGLYYSHAQTRSKSGRVKTKQTTAVHLTDAINRMKQLKNNTNNAPINNEIVSKEPLENA